MNDMENVSTQLFLNEQKELILKTKITKYTFPNWKIPLYAIRQGLILNDHLLHLGCMGNLVFLKQNILHGLL